MIPLLVVRVDWPTFSMIAGCVVFSAMSLVP